MDKNIFEFYNNFIKIPFGDNESRIKLKEQIFSKQIEDNTLYKYISFGLDEILNEKKLQALQNGQLWFAAHYTLRNNDPSEFEVRANPIRVAKALGVTPMYVSNKLRQIRELNDLCCMSDRLDEYMWINYANNHSGCCCVFEVENVDMLWPVIYCDKSKTDFTYDVIQALKNPNFENLSVYKIAYISTALKDKKKYGNENEIRLLCGDVYDSEDGPLGGKILAGKKELLGYTGIYYSYQKCGVKLKKIIIGKSTEKSIMDKIKKLNLGVQIEME